MSISPDEPPPVWAKKEETDRCYNQCVHMLLNAVREDLSIRQDVQTSSHDMKPKDTAASWSQWLKGCIISNPIKKVISFAPGPNKLPSVGILFGTHNWESSRLILRELVHNGLAEPLPEEPRQEDGEVVIRVKPEAVERVAVAQLYGAHLSKVFSLH